MKKNTRILTLVFAVAFLTLLTGCLTPPNQTPIITSDPITTATVGVEFTYDVNATDPDGDTLTYSLDIKPSGMTINSATGLIKWIPTAEGDYPVVVKASDGTLDITQDFTIVVSEPLAINQAPIIYSTPSAAAIVEVAYTYDVDATDPDGDILTYSLTTYPSGMTINSANGLIWWIPTSAQVGNNLVTVTVSDGALIDTQSFAITVSVVEPEPELELTGIKVDPKIMNLFEGESKTITSVTATYEIREYEVPIALGSCTYTSSATEFATVSDAGLVTAVVEGTATITVSYEGKTDTLEVTVKAVELTGPVHNITKDIYYDAIQEAIDAADDGNTIYVANGTYEAATENSQLYLLPDNTDLWFFVNIDKSLNLIGENQDGVILDGTLLSQSGNVTRPTCIWISASNVTVENFTIRNFYNPDNFCYGVVSWKDLRDNSSVDTITDITLNNLKVQDCIASIYFILTEYPTVRNCIVEDGLADGIWIARGGDNAVVENNTVINSGDHGIWVGNCWLGLGPSDNATITDNYIDGAREGGISFVGSDGAIISGNTITNVAGDGWSVGALSLKDGPSDIEAYDNTIYGNYGDWSGYSGTGHGIGVDGIPSNINLYHNNIYDNTGYGIYNYSTVEVGAKDNWWGHISGPTHLANPGGTGDAVSDNVSFDPWSESPN